MLFEGSKNSVTSSRLPSTGPGVRVWHNLPRLLKAGLTGFFFATTVGTEKREEIRAMTVERREEEKEEKRE